MLLEIDEITKARMRTFAQRLPEKNLCDYAAVEAHKLGRGGVAFITELFPMSTEASKKGQRDLDEAGIIDRKGRIARHAPPARTPVRRTAGSRTAISTTATGTMRARTRKATSSTCTFYSIQQ